MLRPIRDKILIAPQENPMVSPGGIHLPERLQGRPCKGKVVSTGPDVKGIDIGDVVLFNAMGGSELKHDDTKYILIKEELIYVREVEG